MVNVIVVVREVPNNINCKSYRWGREGTLYKVAVPFGSYFYWALFGSMEGCSILGSTTLDMGCWLPYPRDRLLGLSRVVTYWAPLPEK